jgi:hypothetical protein
MTYDNEYLNVMQDELISAISIQYMQTFSFVWNMFLDSKFSLGNQARVNFICEVSIIMRSWKLQLCVPSEVDTRCTIELRYLAANLIIHTLILRKSFARLIYYHTNVMSRLIYYLHAAKYQWLNLDEAFLKMAYYSDR